MKKSIALLLIVAGVALIVLGFLPKSMSVADAGPDEAGYVVLAPEGEGSVVPTPGEYVIPTETVAIFTATSADGWYFKYWRVTYTWTYGGMYTHTSEFNDPINPFYYFGAREPDGSLHAPIIQAVFKQLPPELDPDSYPDQLPGGDSYDNPAEPPPEVEESAKDSSVAQMFVGSGLACAAVGVWQFKKRGA